MPGVQPVAHVVALFRQSRQVQPAHLANLAGQLLGDVAHVSASLFVVVVQQDHTGRAFKLGGVLGFPLRPLFWLGRALDIGSGHQTKRRQTISVLFSLADEDSSAFGNGGAKFGQAVEHVGCVSWAFPQPAALSVRPALAEVFWLVSDFLECLATIKVAVGIRGDDAALAVVARLWRDTQHFEDFQSITPSVAMNNHRHGIADLDR